MAAVGLDDESGRGPEEVDLVVEDGDVDRGQGQRVVAAGRQDDPLELAADALEREGGRGEQSAEDADAGMAGAARDELVQAGAVEDLEVAGAIEAAAQLGGRQQAGEVEEGAGGRGRPDPVVDDDVARRERARPVHQDAPRPASVGPRHRDVDRASRPRPVESEVTSARGVAEGGAGPAGEHRGEVAALPRDAGVADGEDAAADPMQVPGIRPARDRGGAQTRLEELAMGDDPVLTGCDRRDPCGWGGLVSHMRLDQPQLRWSRPPGRER